MISVDDRLDNIVGKGENAGNHHFLLFPQCFLEISFLRMVKSRNCVLTLYYTIPTFKEPWKESSLKHCEKRKECWKPAFSPFPTMFLIQLEGVLPGSVVNCLTHGSWVQAALDPLGFLVGVSLDKTLQSPSLVLVKPRKDMNNVNCNHDMTEILLKAA